MKKDVSDQEFDRMMQSLVSDASRDDELRSIADSPTVWWAVQREIAKGSEAKSPWPPANIVRRWLMILVPAGVAAALAISLFISLPTTSIPDVAAIGSESQIAATAALPEDIQPVNSLPVATGPSDVIKTTERSIIRKQLPIKGHNISTQLAKSTNKITETKTDFIALTYARNPESGQIVRVKVPRSMMAQVGLVASVSKPNDLVDAEVVVGDDGLTRAIRFIH